MLIVHLIDLLLIGFGYILGLLLRFFLLCLHNIFYTKTVFLYINILSCPIFHISLCYFFFLKIQKSLILIVLAVFLLTYEYNLGILPLLLYLLLSNYIVLEVSALFLIACFRKILFSYISVQILYGIYSSILYVINYVCHLLMTFSYLFDIFYCSWRTTI